MSSTHVRKVFFAALSIAIVAGLAACGSDSSPTSPGGGTTFHGTVQVDNNFFSPATATISVGDSVTWHWNGGFHSVTSKAGQPFTFDSGTKSNGTFGFRFMSAGTEQYFCTVHGNAMSGTIIVKP
jgi:plastocyanin